MGSALAGGGGGGAGGGAWRPDRLSQEGQWSLFQSLVGAVADDAGDDASAYEAGGPSAAAATLRAGGEDKGRPAGAADGPAAGEGLLALLLRASIRPPGAGRSIEGRLFKQYCGESGGAGAVWAGDDGAAMRAEAEALRRETAELRRQLEIARGGGGGAGLAGDGEGGGGEGNSGDADRDGANVAPSRTSSGSVDAAGSAASAVASVRGKGAAFRPSSIRTYEINDKVLKGKVAR